MFRPELSKPDWNLPTVVFLVNGLLSIFNGHLSNRKETSCFFPPLNAQKQPKNYYLSMLTISDFSSSQSWLANKNHMQPVSPKRHRFLGYLRILFKATVDHKPSQNPPVEVHAPLGVGSLFLTQKMEDFFE